MSVFTVDDIRLLEKTISIRERMIDNLLTSELPTKARDLDSYTNLLESVDRSIIQKAKINIEETSNKINEETKGVLTDLLLSLHRGAIPTPTLTEDSYNGDSVPRYEPREMEINEGVLIPKTDHINIGDVIQE